jgi:hypothetical protein
MEAIITLYSRSGGAPRAVRGALKAGNEEAVYVFPAGTCEIRYIGVQDYPYVAGASACPLEFGHFQAIAPHGWGML